MITDFHSHVLPCMDDGSVSVEQSIQMLQAEAEQGITHVIATPHFYAGRTTPERFLEKRNISEAMLREEMAKHEGLPKLSVGAEVHFFSGISDSEAIKLLTIAGNSCILLEMKESPWGEYVYREIQQIWEKQGLTPIIAHVDRYIGPWRDYGIPARLEQLPVAVQANAEFFLRPSTARMAMRMLSRGQVHVLGSDCHNMSSRKPNLGLARQRIEKKLGNRALEHISRWEAALLEEKM
jgi:protein-tyrosine phosphatase